MVSKRSVRIRLEEDLPTVNHLIEVLHGAQDEFYAIGRYLTRTSKQGRLAEKVKNECSLVITKISMRSPLSAEVSIAPISKQIYFEDTGSMISPEDLGEPCIGLFEKVVEAHGLSIDETEKKIHELIDGAEYRLDITRHLHDMIPKNVPVNMTFGRNAKEYRLDRKTKNQAFVIASREEEELRSTIRHVKNIRGPVVEAQIIDDVHFKVNELLCKFSEADVPRIQGLLGKVVSLSGKATIKEGKIVELTKIIDLNQILDWQFATIEADSIQIELSEPLNASVSFESGSVWITDDLDLGIIGIGKRWEDAINDFNEGFVTKLIGYVVEPDERLTGDAIEVRDKLRALVPHWREVYKDATEHS